PGRSDHKNLSGFSCQVGMVHSCRRCGEVNYRINSFKQCPGIVTDQNTTFFQTGNQGDILSNKRAVWQVSTTANLTAAGPDRFIDQHAPHTAGTSDNPDFHLRSPPASYFKRVIALTY